MLNKTQGGYQITSAEGEALGIVYSDTKPRVEWEIHFTGRPMTIAEVNGLLQDIATIGE